MFAARITLPHFSISATMYLPNSAGVIGIGALPSSASRAFRLGSDMPKTTLDTISTAVRVSLLAAGPYIATFPSSSMRLYADRFSLAVLPVALPIRPWPVALVTLKNRTLSPVVERFLECTREVAKSFSAWPQALRP
jgi:DNA-binding transcriptional LysR family regulator